MGGNSSFDDASVGPLLLIGFLLFLIVYGTLFCGFLIDKAGSIFETPDASDLPPSGDFQDCEYESLSLESEKLTIGGYAIVQNALGNGLACRICPGRQDEPPAQWLENGETVEVLEGPVSVTQDSWAWWLVKPEGESSCWAAEENWLARIPEDPPTDSECIYTDSQGIGNLIIGDKATVVGTVEGLGCRSCPGVTSEDPERRLPNGIIVTVEDGPVDTVGDFWNWWYVTPPDGNACWVAEENWLLHIPPTPKPDTCHFNEPFWGEQWNMEQIELARALYEFPNCSPSKIIVAIIDTGVQINNIDLENRIEKVTTSIGDNGLDINGHGTHVAGIIGANSNNGYGVVGIHPNVQMLIYKYGNEVEDSYGWEDLIQANILNVANLIRTAVDEGATVINISTGFPWDVEEKSDIVVQPCFISQVVPCNGELKQAVEYALEHNVIIVASAGNIEYVGQDTNTLRYPAAYAEDFINVIAVAASAPNGTLSPISYTGSHVTIAAPGGAGIRCQANRNDCIISLSLQGESVELQGTSQAAPHVTGIIALMLSMNPELSPTEIRQLIEKSAIPYSSPPGKEAGGGIINAFEAVRLANK